MKVSNLTACKNFTDYLNSLCKVPLFKLVVLDQKGESGELYYKDQLIRKGTLLNGGIFGSIDRFSELPHKKVLDSFINLHHNILDSKILGVQRTLDFYIDLYKKLNIDGTDDVIYTSPFDSKDYIRKFLDFLHALDIPLMATYPMHLPGESPCIFRFTYKITYFATLSIEESIGEPFKVFLKPTDREVENPRSFNNLLKEFREINILQNDVEVYSLYTPIHQILDMLDNLA